jgi:predicted flap endonuclease-1-like 5' DNA nuclease
MVLIEKTAAMSELTGIPNFLKLSDQVWTGGQPWPEHLPKLKDAGVKVVINLRPHAEHQGASEEAKVKELGMSYFNIPVVTSAPDELDADDFLKIKGIGPKLADMLHARGFHRFEQLAHLTPEEIEMIDQQLGPFAGRIRRDRIVEQAGYLARGDVDGFEQHFGKL